MAIHSGELEFWEAFTPAGAVRTQADAVPERDPDPEPPDEPEPGGVPAPADLAGLDPVTSLLASLQGLGFSGEVASDWVGVLVAQVTADGVEAPGVPVDSSDAGVLSALSVMARTGEALLAAQIVQVQDLVLRIGPKLLATRGVTDPGALSKSARISWRSQAKAAAAGEVEVKMGVSSWEARHLVAIATSPSVLRAPLLGALRRGEVTRKLVLVYQSSIRRLAVDQAAHIAQVLFGTDPGTAAVERLDVEGDLELGRPWQHAKFHAALKREITRVKSQDEAGADRDRQAAHQDRDASLTVEDDGTSRVTCSMSTVTGVAVMARVDDMARRARKNGDPRTLGQLRSDLMAALLLYGTITPPGAENACCCDSPDQECQRSESQTLEGFDEIVTPEDIEALRAIITATPAGRVDVIVPWEDLIGAVCATCRTPIHDPGSEPRERDNDDGQAPGQGQGQSPGRDSTGDPPAPDFDQPHSRCSRTAPCRQGQDSAPGQEPVASQELVPGREPAPGREPVAGGESPVGEGPVGTGRVAELIGWESAFITGSQVRQIVLTPGTQLHRVLVDPADGRCLERSIKNYAPDADMRRQVRAADVYGRGPGSRRPAGQCELDHEKEWLTHGWTAETNLNNKAVRDHLRKTVREWFTVMNRRRDVTFTTMLGQIATTRGHDYRQYYPRFTTTSNGTGGTESDDGQGSDAHAGVDQSDLFARRDLANQIIYAALVHRGPGDRAEAADDSPDSEDWLTRPDWLQITHTNHHGQRRHGTPPSHPTPEDLLHPGHGTTGQDGQTGNAGADSTADDDTQGQAPAPASPWTQAINDRPAYGPPPF